MTMAARGNFKEDWKAMERFRAKCTHPDRHVIKMNGKPVQCGRCFAVLAEKGK